ncbi:hypothetical protein SAMN05216464_102242 [Mucilaginibacter pineti]|uniref:Uncharacterized protein n=1 Tax=Mucilaginibacter pineti TaxID=1391627 RepID=A0A1G6WMY2_9SPHI|nr:hypothetical protein [Mucilaginibacter pineti]SDD67242.1 hypothetical protein SAMN05216464_102242 [Mucilaginibacter pineti]
MKLLLSYETLFELNIKHHYHLDDGDKLFDTLNATDQLALQNRYNTGDFLSISPTLATRALMAGCNVVCKVTSTGVITGIQYLSNAGVLQPLINPADTKVFSFAITITDGLFSNYSTLPLQAPAGMVYYFTNDPSFSARVFPYLTATVATYQPGVDYYPGDMLVDNQATPAKLFIAQQKNNLNPGLGATPAGNWITDTLVAGKPLAYASTADMVRRSGRVFTYEVTVPGKTPNLIITDRQGNTIPVITVLETGDLNTIKADISAQPEGLYHAQISTADASYTDSFPFYFTHDAAAWAFVDVCVKTGKAAHDLFKADGSLKSPVFSLRFKNRATYWRYVGKSFGAASVSDNALPLTRQGFIAVKVKDKNNNLTTDELPNASAAMIKPEMNQIFSDIFI